MIRVVIDTNVLVSAIWNSKGIPARVVDAIYAGTLEPVLSESILREYREVLLCKKFSFPADVVNQMLHYFKLFLLPLPPEQVPYRCSDPEDSKFLAAAIAGGASYLVTGNRRHYPKKVAGIEIVTPREMISVLANKG